MLLPNSPSRSPVVNNPFVNPLRKSPFRAVEFDMKDIENIPTNIEN